MREKNKIYFDFSERKYLRSIVQSTELAREMPNKTEKISTLNLPAAPLQLREKDGKQQVFDILRRRFITLTPEEWVRQHFVHYLMQYKGYPSALLGNEISLSLGNMRKRCDSVLYDKQARPIMIVEYKASHIAITQNVFDQICRYNIALHVPYLIVSNGLQHYCCKVDYEKGTYSFLADVPQYQELISF